MTLEFGGQLDRYLERRANEGYEDDITGDWIEPDDREPDPNYEDWDDDGPDDYYLDHPDGDELYGDLY